jgi:outer membrane protein assembly complex protein YaeT
MLLAASSAAVAQPPEPDYEGRNVVSVEFRPADQPYARLVLDQWVAIKTGKPLDAAQVRTTIQNLYATGRYADVRIDAEPNAQGVQIIIETEPDFFIGQVTVTGAKDPPNTGQLAAATKLELGRPFIDSDANVGLENISDRLRVNGLYKATVTYTIEHVAATQQAKIHFTVNAGKRAKFDGVEVAGNPQRSLESIVRASHWKWLFTWLGWHSVTEARVRTGIENVRKAYQSANQLLSRVTMEQLEYHQDSNTVTPRLYFDPGPKVEITSTGAKMSKGTLKNLVPVYQERTVDKDLLVEGRRNLLDYFQAQGYFDAQVNFQLLPEQDGKELISYTFDRGVRHRLRSLEFSGNHYFNNETIKERMAVIPASWPRYPRGRFSQKLLDRDIDAITILYRSNGFRNVKVTTQLSDDLNGVAGDLGVHVNIVEGPQWFVRKLAMPGATADEAKYFRTIISSLEGQPFSETDVADDREDILNYYFNRGYPDTTFEWTTSDTGTPNHVDLTFTIKHGHRQYVRDILINGLHTTNPRLVTSRIRFSPGDALAESSLSDTQRRLYELGIFAKVQVAIQNPAGDEPSRYVLYQLDEASLYSVTTGVGAEFGRIGGGTTLDAPAGTSGFTPQVTVGVSRLNLFGIGHTLSLQTKASTVEQRALLTYFAPHFLENEKLNLTISGLFDNSHDVRTFASKRLEGSIQLGRRLSRADSIQVRFQIRRVTVDQSTLNINPQLVPLFSQPDRTGIISASFIHDKRDDPLDAKRGMYNTIDFGVAATQFGSKTPFTRLVERNSTYYQLRPGLVFARSTNFGVILPYGNFGSDADIPLAERFFSGGSFSHRGFPNNQAGPRDLVTGFPLGGDALLMNTFELRFPLIGDNLTGAVFHDAGNVYSSVDAISFRSTQRNNQDFDYMVHAVGVGFRYKTPVGPMRVDFSYSPNAPRFIGFQGTRDELIYCAGPGSLGTVCPSIPQKINSFQFHFSLGQSF